MAFCLGLDQMKGKIMKGAGAMHTNKILYEILCMDFFFVCIFVEMPSSVMKKH